MMDIEYHFKHYFDYEKFCADVLPTLEECIVFPETDMYEGDTDVDVLISEEQCQYGPELMDMLSRIGLAGKDGCSFPNAQFKCTYIEGIFANIFGEYYKFPFEVDCTIELIRDE